MIDRNNIYKLKRKIAMVFHKLTQEGYIAKMNYACCTTCGFAELTDIAADLEKNGEKIKGIIFYHGQGEDYLWEDGSVYLKYKAYNNDSHAATIKVGECIVNKFREVGVNVEWDGNPNKAIMLYV